MKRSVQLTLVAVFVAWHLFSVWSQWTVARTRTGGADFASYYYAVQVAKQGGDPYRMRQLNRAAVKDKNPATKRPHRSSVHPYFYPAPFLLLTAWVDAFELDVAYKIWFWLDELFTILCGLVLWRWWRPLGDALPVVIAATIAVLSAIPNNHLMGQANLPVLFLLLVGLWQEEEGREVLGGALVGTACMLKMSPALFVAWWLLRWRWRPALAACATAVVLSMASLALVDMNYQVRFYTEVLPRFANGNYNGLRVPIDLFGNHSNPNLLHWFFPGGPHKLSPMSQELSRISTLAMVGALGTLFWAEVDDKLRVYGQLSAVCVAMLLIPVYTYEHHVVWAIPAVVLLAMAWWTGRLPRWTGALLGAAVLLWAVELSWLKPFWVDFKRAGSTVPMFLVQELKWAALVILLVLAAFVGRSRPA